MKYLLLSVLVVLVAVMVVPDAFAATYTDPNNKFSIEYPSGWLKEMTDSSVGDVRFTDKYNWNADMQVFNYDLSFGDYRGMSDSAILEELKELERDICNTSTYQDNTFVCYNYRLVSADYFLTEQNKIAYFVNSKYTKQYEELSGEHPMQSIVSRVIEGAYHWEITSEMEESHVDRYFDMLLRNALSFKLLQGQGVTQSTSPLVPTSTSFKKYTDDRDRFTIEYPGNWLKGADGLGHIDSEIAFSDKADWNVMAQVFFYDGDTPDDRTDYQVLKQIVYNDSEICEDATFALDDRICYDYEKIDSYTMEAFNGNKIYFVKSSYTLEFDDPSYPGEYPMITALGLVYGKDGSWEINIESDDFAFAKNSDEIMLMIKSLSVESTSTPTPTYIPPACILFYPCRNFL